MKARLTMLLAIAIAVAGITAGCGSGSDDGSSSDGSPGTTSEGQSGDSSEGQSEGGSDASGGTDGGGSIDKATFVKKASAACQQQRQGALERVAAYQAKHRGEGRSEAELTEDALKAVVLSTVAAEVAALRKLEPPSGEEREFEAVLAAVERDLEQAQKSSANSSSDEVEGSFGASSKKLGQFGIPSCAK